MANVGERKTAPSPIHTDVFTQLRQSRAQLSSDPRVEDTPQPVSQQQQPPPCLKLELAGKTNSVNLAADDIQPKPSFNAAKRNVAVVSPYRDKPAYLHSHQLGKTKQVTPAHSQGDSSSQFCVPSEKEISFAAPTMVAVAPSVSHRPVLHKSHSVAFGTDCTLPHGNYHHHHHHQQKDAHTFFPPSTFVPPQSSTLDKASTVFKNPLVSQLAKRTSGEFTHQGSFGFNVAPSHDSKMLRRCESLGFDSSAPTKSPEPLLEGHGSEKQDPAVVEDRRGSLQDSRSASGGKWKRRNSGTLTRRAAFRTKPLCRTNSRTNVTGTDSGHMTGATLTRTDSCIDDASRTVESTSVQDAFTVSPSPSPTTKSFTPSPPPPPLQRQLSRRRSYRQSTTEDDDDEKADERTVTVEDVVEEEEEEESFTPPTTPRETLKKRRVDMGSFDPYQMFEVQHLPCIILTVKVLCGRNISNGWFQDRLDTPDPYVKLRVKTAPEGRQRTRTIDDSINPVWNETFTFFLAFSEENVLELTLMEANPFNLDQQVDTVIFRVHDRIEEFGKWQTEVFTFTGGSEIDVAFHMEWDQNPTLRYSLCLSDPEKEFMRKRKNKVYQALNELLGEQGPRTVDEAPTIAVIGSGGGFRAMTGYSGVFKALHTTGLLDCATYACGLSGSSWYLSTLYSHPRWPEMNPRDMQSELMNNIDKSLMRLLSPQSIIRYINSVITKRRQGQPVSFTDFFGHMVGETLLKGRLDSKLTDQREKIKDGDVPMPLYTCVHVKKDVPARSFQEWVEFSPYEIGLPKYGTFMDSELFGSKFFMGKLARKYQEPPLHFLQGIWGSAFCILFKRLMEDNRNMDPAEMIRREMGQQLQEQNDNDDDSSDLSDDDSDEDDEESDDEVITEALAKRRDSNELVKKRRGSKDVEKRRKGSLVPPSFIKRGSNDSQADSCDSSDRDTSDSESHVIDLRPPESFLKRQDSSEGFDDVDTPSCSFRRSASPNTPTPMEGAPRPIRRTSNLSGSENNGLSSSPDCPKKGVRFSQLVDQYEQRKAKQLTKKTVSGKPVLKRASSSRRGKSKSYWSSVMKGIFEYQKFELLTTRSGRAAVIHNFMRGLSLQQTYPLSPFTPLQERVQEGDEFDGIFDMHPTHIKHIYMVDAGLTFNSPYPLILRPQRGVDVILSFDFSGRPSDSTPPFKELLLAEKWARLNRLPFPPIDPTIVEREGLKELYVFQNPDDPHCPVVLHFALVNINFREFKAPGVRRETQEEKDFADFDIFDDPARPYSTFNFTYTHEQFLRLSQLTEFNTLLSMPRVKQVLAEVVARKRKAAPRGAVQPGEIKLLRMKSVQEKRQLKKFLKRMESMGKIVPPTPTPSGTAPPTPFFTPTPLEHKLERNPFVFRYKSSSSSSGSSQPDQSVQGDLNPFFKTSRQDSQLDATRSPSTYDGTSSPRENLNPFFRNTSREGSQIRTTSADVPNRTTSHVKYSDNGLLQASKQDSHSKAPFSGVSSHQNGEVNPFLLARQDSDTKPRHDGRRNSKTAVRRREPVGFNKQHPNFVTASSSSPPPSPSPSPEHSNYNHSNPQQQTSPHPDTVRQSSDTTDGLTRHASRVSEASSVSDDEFFDAPESFKRDGTPVTDHHEAKMHFEGAKERRKLLRRQSTISSLSSSITNSVSLDSAEDDHQARASLSSSTGAANIDVNDLDQFEGIDLDHNHAGNNAQDDEEDPFFNTSHRGSVVTIVEQGES